MLYIGNKSRGTEWRTGRIFSIFGEYPLVLVTGAAAACYCCLFSGKINRLAAGLG